VTLVQYQLVDRKLSRNFLLDPSRRQVGHPWFKALANHPPASLHFHVNIRR